MSEAKRVSAVPRSLLLSAVAVAATALLSGCLATAPTLGTNKGTVSGAAGGETAEGDNGALEKCSESLGTLALQEDTAAPWFLQLSQYNLGSTVPVLRLMIQQSNCFVIVERGGAMRNMEMERNLARSGESRQGSNFGGGQVVAADYTMSPSIQFSGNTGRAGLASFLPGMAGAIAGAVQTNEASTTLLLIDNRSGVQVSAAEGTARNFDIGILGGVGLLGGLGGGAYSKTPQGKVIVAAFADSYNQMVKALRNYKAQTVKGGLGTGGRLSVDGATKPAAPAKAATPAKSSTPAKTAPAKKTTGTTSSGSK
ncbi:CsgG/HfaB family protein [Rubrivivax sp. JA1026]|uniref:CsgG/HfaB family protein n=1 Tax=Rubrivivax sp. JA1026 TaxID=2710888 RepID=UPI0013E98AB8|nr:CsgG/HfaB family protein [Rubrivivax sp. JA1026]